MTIFNKISNVWLIHKCSGVKCWGENLLAPKGRESVQLTLLHSWHSKRKWKLLYPCLLLPSCKSLKLDVPPFYFLYVLLSILYGFFLCSLPVKSFLVLPLDLWLTLFNTVTIMKKVLDQSCVLGLRHTIPTNWFFFLSK